jgi:hypothetical protein
MRLALATIHFAILLELPGSSSHIARAWPFRFTLLRARVFRGSTREACVHPGLNRLVQPLPDVSTAQRPLGFLDSNRARHQLTQHGRAA